MPRILQPLIEDEELVDDATNSNRLPSLTAPKRQLLNMPPELGAPVAVSRMASARAMRERPDEPEEEEPHKERVSSFALAVAMREQKEKARQQKNVKDRLTTLESSLDELREELEGHPHRMRKVSVKVKHARNLPIMDTTKSDPYVIMSIGGVTKTSSVKRKQLNPIWNETFVFQVNVAEMPKLQLEMFDEDFFVPALSRPTNEDESRDDKMGCIEGGIVLEGAISHDLAISKWFKLTPPEGYDAEGRPPAEIELEITLLPDEEKQHKPGARFNSREIKAGPAVRTERLRRSHTDTNMLSDDNKRMILVGHFGRLRHASEDVRRSAVLAISKISGPNCCHLPKHSELRRTIVKVFCERVEKDTAMSVKLDALNGLAHVGEVGDREIIRAVAHSTRDPHVDVRLLAVSLIRKMAESGNETAITHVGQCLEDADDQVRAAAMDCLPHLSSVFDARLFNECAARLDNMHGVVRMAAARGIATVCTPGAPLVIDALTRAVGDPDANVKVVAMQELARQAKSSGPKFSAIIRAVMIAMKDSRAVVKTGAVEALAHILISQGAESMAMRETQAIIPALIECLNDMSRDQFGHCGVQVSALEALRSISTSQRQGTDNSSALIMEAVRAKVSAPDWLVRQHALLCLSALGNHSNTDSQGDDEMLSDLVGLLEDSNVDVRNDAARTVLALTSWDDPWLFATVACRLTSPSSEIRATTAGLLLIILPGKDNDDIPPATVLNPPTKQKDALPGILSKKKLTPAPLSQTDAILPTGGASWKVGAAGVAPRGGEEGKGGREAGGSFYAGNAGASFRRVESKALRASQKMLKGVQLGRVPTSGDVLEVLSQVVSQQGDERAMAGFMEATMHKNAHVRKLAADALERFALASQPSVVDHLTKCLTHAKPEIRCDAALCLSRVTTSTDENAIRELCILIDDPEREVREAVPIALRKVLPDGDTRLLLSQAIPQLEPGFNEEKVRREAVKRLTALAYDGSRLRVHGHSIEDADLQSFWQMIRQPRENNNTAEEILKRINGRLEDEDVWVRKAAVDGIKMCAPQECKDSLFKLSWMVGDDASAVRAAALDALAVIAPMGDSHIVQMLMGALQDTSHIVRGAAVQALRALVRIGDRIVARQLMTWLRKSWLQIAVLGNDTKIRTAVARLLMDVLEFQHPVRSHALLDGIADTNVHKQRNVIAGFEDFLVEETLIKPDDRKLHAATLHQHLFEDPSGKFNTRQIWVVVRIQRWAYRSIRRKQEQRIQGLQKNKRVMPEKGTRESSKDLLDPLEDPPPETRYGAAPSRYRNFHMVREDHASELIVRRMVPINLRRDAQETAKAKSRSETPLRDRIVPWLEMRWVERLRLCEEIAGHTIGE